MRYLLRLLALAPVFGALLVIFAAGAALADQTYSDAPGDSSGADILGVAVRNAPDGIVAFQVSLAAPLAGDQGIALYLDTDRNPTTGEAGDDYLLVVGPRLIPVLASWDGSVYTPTSLPVGLGVSGLVTNALEIRFNRSAFANLTGLNFDLTTFRFADGDLSQWDTTDAAPDAGAYGYDLVLSRCANGKDDDADGQIDGSDLGCSSTTDDNEADDPVSIRLGRAKTTPTAPKAGRIAKVSLTTMRVETSRPLDEGVVTCQGAVSARTLKGAGFIAGGSAVCTFRVPAVAQGKVVRGQITVAYRGASATAPFRFRVAS